MFRCRQPWQLPGLKLKSQPVGRPRWSTSHVALRPATCLLAHWRSTLSVCACQPSPVERKHSITSTLQRTESSNFLFSDFGLPRATLIGTGASRYAFVMGFSCGATLATATIFALSLSVGIKMTRLLGIFDIFSHLSSLGEAQTDDSAHIATINKRHVIQHVALWNESHYSQPAIRIPWVNPNIHIIPNQLLGKAKR